jgi:hypothetical protein
MTGRYGKMVLNFCSIGLRSKTKTIQCKLVHKYFSSLRSNKGRISGTARNTRPSTMAESPLKAAGHL